MRRSFLIASLATALVCALPTYAESFRNPVRIATKVDPSDVSVVDLNGDGRPDILWTALGSLLTDQITVHTFLAQVSGGFAEGPVLTLPTHVTPYCRTGDVTGDGKADLVCTYANAFDAALLTFPGNGDGSFGSPVTTNLPSSQNNDIYFSPVLHPMVDVNHDGKADAVIENAGTGGGFVLLGQADGSFKLTDTIGAESLPQYLDINADGHIDMLFPFNEILLGDGTGQFKAISPGFGVAGLCVFGRVDSEPNIDAVCSQELTTDGDLIGGTQLLIFHGNGDGTFNPHPIKTVTFGDHTNELNGRGTFLNPLSIVDLNGDGIPDILAAAGDGVTILLGQPGLNFSYPVHYATGYLPGSTALGSVGEFSYQISDLNGDGLPDLVSSGPNGIYINYGRKDGTFDTARAYEVTQVIGYQTVADFNEDGKPDVVATGDEAIELSLGRGDGTFQSRIPLPRGEADFSTPLSAGNAHIVHGDFNGDHHQDIIAVGSPSIYEYDQYILFGHGDGTFSTPALISNTSQTYPNSIWFSAFDVNGDGRDDVFSSDSSNLYFAISKGDGSFTTVTTKAPSDASPSGNAVQCLPVLGDFDGDGKVDAVVGTGTSVYLLKGHGDGGFDSPTVKLPIPAFMGVPSQGANAVAAGDFDGDGHLDIALIAATGLSLVASTDSYESSLFIYYGDGHGGFSDGVPVTGFDQYYTAMRAADLNKDGLDDLVFYTSAALGDYFPVGVVDALPGRTFGSEVSYDAGSGLADLSIVDLNHDAFPDLVFGNGEFFVTANSVTVLMNLGDTGQVSGTLHALPEPSIAGQPFQLLADLKAPDGSTLEGDVSFSIDGVPVGSAPLESNTASLPVTTVLKEGTHTIRADWPGNSNYAAIFFNADHQVVTAFPTSTSIASSRDPAPLGAPVTFSVAVQSANGTPLGSVTLTDGVAQLATIELSEGAATYTTSDLAVGSHILVAAFVPNSGWVASSGSITEQINRIDANVNLAVKPDPIYAWQIVDLTATLSATGQMPTGTVTFQDQSNSLGTQALTSGTATFSTTFPAAGSYSLSAQYSGDKNYDPITTSPVSETVLINPTATQLSVATSPAIAFQTITLRATVSSTTTLKPYPGGSISFFDGKQKLGSAALVNGVTSLATASLGGGVHPIAAVYGGDPAFSMSSSTVLPVAVQKAPSAVQLASSLNPAGLGAAILLTATVAGEPSSGGTVTFLDGTTQLGQPVTLSVSGMAALTTNTLSSGTHSVTALYSGDANLLASTSAPLQQMITPPGDFTIAVSPASAAFIAGGSATLQITVSPTNGFNQPLALTCAGVPAGSTCSFTPQSLPNGQGGSVLILQTAGPNSNSKATSAALRMGSGGVLLASFALFFMPLRRRRAFISKLLSLSLIVITFIFLGCGGGTHHTSGGTPPGTYQITITAATSSSPALSHSTVVTMIVKSAS